MFLHKVQLNPSNGFRDTSHRLHPFIRLAYKVLRPEQFGELIAEPLSAEGYWFYNRRMASLELPQTIIIYWKKDVNKNTNQCGLITYLILLIMS